MSAAVLLYEGCTITEVAEIATRLTNWDVSVQFVAPSMAELRDQSGLRMLPDIALGDVDPSGLTVVIVPGGNPDTVIDDPAVRSWLQHADEAGVLVAAICAGVTLVASAGLVAGRRITHNFRPPWAPPEGDRGDLLQCQLHLLGEQERFTLRRRQLADRGGDDRLQL